jgi:ribosomal protein S12 methylthiotransferase accessory factor
MKKMPVRMTDCFKHYTFDQDKVCTPVETVARFKKKLSEVDLDILKEVRRIDNGRLDIPVYFSLTGKDAFETIGNKKQMGKGSTPEQSQASACMELAERFSFFAFKKNFDNFLQGTYQQMPPDAARKIAAVGARREHQPGAFGKTPGRCANAVDLGHQPQLPG